MKANEAIRALEEIIDRKVKHYRTDWTDYDLPKLRRLMLMHKACIFIARDCGTELYSVQDVIEGYEGAVSRLEYYTTQDGEDNEVYLISCVDTWKIQPASEHFIKIVLEIGNMAIKARKENEA